MRMDTDPGFYIDKPQEFARFYIVARGYSVLWGVIGTLVVFALARRMGAGLALAAMASLCFVFLPVTVDLAHEAKPHLAGAVILLLAVLAASKYVETGKLKWVLWTGIACGAAVGMVLSGIVGLLILPVMAIARRDKPVRWIGVVLLGLIAAASVYSAANPYVLIHLINHDGALKSNLDNSMAMYPAGSLSAGILNAIKLIVVGTSLPLALVGLAGMVCLPIMCKKCGKSKVAGETSVVPQAAGDETKTAEAKPACGFGIGWMLAAVAIVTAVVFAITGAGKPGEYARFAIFIDVALALAAVAFVNKLFKQPAMQITSGVVLVLLTAIFSAAYIRGFLLDSTANNSRIVAAKVMKDDLETISQTHRAVLGIYAEPAPYVLPPFDLFRWRVVLLPKSWMDTGTV